MSSGPKISTTHGYVSGIRRKTGDGSSVGKNYNAFFGIPYAKQPSGELRFRDPEPIEPWAEVFDATRETTGAFQVSDVESGKKEVSGSDNCLILNIYTPKFSGRLPVFLWIHGGGFAYGSSTTALYRPDYFIEKNIVVVTINYRLGVVGFLSFKDESIGIAGNAGLKDQYMAMKWVKENIDKFGGNPENITVGGDSSGGISIHYHLMSPLCRGLFKRAIIESGSAFCPWGSLPKNEYYEYELARAVGWNGEGGDRGAFEAIKTTRIETLVTTANELIKDPELTALGSVSQTPFLPRVEWFKSKLCFIDKSIVELGKTAWGNEVDIIFGENKDEGIFFESYHKEASVYLEKSLSYLIPILMRRTLNEEKKSAAAEILRNIYFKQDEEVSFQNLFKFCEAVGDLQFTHSFHRFLLQRHRNGGSGKTFYYYLSTNVDPEIKFYKVLRQFCKVSVNTPGTCHTDEIPLIWKSVFSPKPLPKNKIFQTFVQFFGAYSSFIKTGDPNNPMLGSKWNTSDDKGEGFICMHFTANGAKCEAVPNAKKMIEWDKLYKDEELA